MRMRQPDRNLGQALPEVAFGHRAGLPQIFEYLVRMEWPLGTEQFVRQPHRVIGVKVLRDQQLNRVGVRTTGERASERVAGTRIAWPASRISTPAPRSGSGSANQPVSSVSKPSG